LYEDFGLMPCVGTEIEFYLPDDNISNAPFVLKKEKGLHQYEIDLPPTTDMLEAVGMIISAKNSLEAWRGDINFEPKSFADDYGSAMHFHINLLKNGDNYFDDEGAIELAAKSLCHYLLPTFLAFAPKKSHYARYDGKMMAPSRVAYGGNNRSLAIRIPDMVPRRLEHRVSSPMTDPYLAVFTIIQSLYLGLKNPDDLGAHRKIYGNAFDEQYALKPLPRDIESAMTLFDEGFYLVAK